jgi:thiol-disulfide isomerase/thioredoxin
MLQEAKKSGVIVTDDEVEQIIDKTIAKAQISKNDFKKYLAEQNLTYEDMQMFYRTNLMIEKFLEKTAYVGINITSNQIKGFYKNNSAELVNITFEEVADQIEAYLLQQAKQEAFKAYAAKVMAEADIRILTKGSPIAEATEGNFSSTDVEKYASCATKNGLDKKSVVFIYSDSCPHCQRMKPIVTELEGAGANFKWASVYDSDMKVALSECYKDVLADGVPQFICARDGQTIVGETSQANLGAFAAACNK